MNERPFPTEPRPPNPHIFLVSIEMTLLSDVLRHVREDVERQLAAIEELVEGASEVPDDFDWEAASDLPLTQMELTSRAVGHELVAIVENRMHEIAKEPWLTSKWKGPKSIDDIPGGRNLQGDALLDALATLKEVSKLKCDELVTLIEGHYGFRFATLQRWSELLELREIVNSLKHRRGRRNWKRHKQKGWPKNLLERDDIDFTKAAKAIEDVREFLFDLERVVRAGVSHKG